MEVAVRPAGREDAEVLAELEGVARGDAAAQRGGPELLATCGQAGAGEWVARIDGASDWYAAAGTIDGEVVGYAAARVVGGIATIHHLYVLEGAREVGVGEGLIEHLLAWAPAVGATTIEATALPGDRQTKNLFERSGMKARAITVSRRLP